VNLDADNNFVYNFVPQYPPKSVQLAFRFSRSVENGSAISEYIKKDEYFWFTIDQVLDWNKTAIVGVDLVGK